MGERAFSKLQWGKETTRGTAVAADTMVLAAPIQITPDRTPHRPQDLSGVRSRSRAGRSYFYEYLVRNSLNFDADHPGYFQILPMLFSCGLKGNITPSEVTPAQGDYLWPFTPSLTASNAPDTVTLEVGDDVQAYETEHVMFERYQIAGEVSQDGGPAQVTLAADFFGRQWSTASFTGAIALPTVTPMNSALATITRDTAWSGVGGTAVNSILRAFNIEILTGVHPKFHGSAARYFNVYGESYIDVMASFTFEGNSDADAIWDLMNSQALSVVRLAITGPQIGTGTNHSLIVDVGGTWENVIPMGGEDRGNNLHTAVLKGEYDPTGAKMLQLSVTTNVAAI